MKKLSLPMMERITDWPIKDRHPIQKKNSTGRKGAIDLDEHF